MARILLVLSLLCLVPLVVLGQGTSIGTAVALPLSGTTNTSMSDASTTHYWKITTTANTYVRVEVTSSSSIDVDVTLYDTNGSTTLLFDPRYGTYSEVFDFLKPGTYYVKANRFQGTTGTYTVTTTSLIPSRAADAETNDSPSSALTLSPTGTSTGHLGFHGTSAADNDDSWKITTSQDGWLRIQVRSDSLDLRADGTDAIFDLDATLYKMPAALHRSCSMGGTARSPRSTHSSDQVSTMLKSIAGGDVVPVTKSDPISSLHRSRTIQKEMTAIKQQPPRPSTVA